MKQKNRDKLKKIISITIFLVWLVVIFYFSHQASYQSDNSSSHVIDLLNKFFLKLDINLYNYDFTITMIRKLAHMFSYFILSIITYNLFREFKLSKQYLYTIIFCIIYAMSDELHQLFIPGRSAEVLDVLIDTLGIMIGILFIRMIKNVQNKKLLANN